MLWVTLWQKTATIGCGQGADTAGRSQCERRLRIIPTTSAHNPDPLTRDYLERHVGHEALQAIDAFARQQGSARQQEEDGTPSRWREPVT